jgi:hypothetical protein
MSGETHYPWRAVDHEGEVLESFTTMTGVKTSSTRRSQSGVNCWPLVAARRDFAAPLAFV